MKKKSTRSCFDFYLKNQKMALLVHVYATGCCGRFTTFVVHGKLTVKRAAVDNSKNQRNRMSYILLTQVKCLSFVRAALKRGFFFTRQVQEHLVAQNAKSPEFRLQTERREREIRLTILRFAYGRTRVGVLITFFDFFLLF